MSHCSAFALATDVRKTFFIFGFIIQASLVISNEYCLSDFFNATCGEEEVVVMTTALHGRMRSGRCIRMEYDKERCQKDVIRFMDKICSGRRSCSFPVATLREAAQVCHSDLSTYLEASYRCVKVSSEVCYHHFFRPSVDHSKVQHPSPNEAFLILPTKSNHEPPHSARVGSPSCPWQIILDPRQKIKFILYSFGTDEEPDSKGFPSSSYLPSCSASLVFEENSHVTHEKLCRSSSSRKWTVFTSTWYSVTVYIRLNQFEAPGIHLLQYEAIGCPSIKPPSGATVSYEGQSATIRCNTTGDEWQMTCQGAHWFGEMSNCSEAIQPDAMSRDGLPLLSFSYLPYGLATAVTIGVLLGIVVGSVPLGLAYVFLKRKWQKTSKDLLQSEAYDMQSRKIDSEDPLADQSCPQLFFHNAQQPLVGSLECECYGPRHHHHHQTFIPTPKSPPMEIINPDGIPRSDFPDIGMRQILMHAPAKHYFDQTRVTEGLPDKAKHSLTPSKNDPKLMSIDTAVYFDVQLSPNASHSVGVNRERHHPDF